VVAQAGVLSLVPSYGGCSPTVSAGGGHVSGTLAAPRSFPSTGGSPVGPTVDLYTASAPAADSIGYVQAAAGTQLAYPAGITVRLIRYDTIRYDTIRYDTVE